MSPTDPSHGPSTDDLIAQVFGELAQDPAVRGRARRLVQRLQAEESSARAVRPPLPVSEAESALTGEAGRYRFRKQLGRGGMGLVLRVHDQRLNRSVAMKILRPDRSHLPLLQSRFIEEAQTTAQLDHPGVVPIYDFGWLPDGRVYYTMQEVRGRDLSHVIARLHASSSPTSYDANGPVTFRRLVDAFRHACEAVAYAHSRGVIHRDLKPENILLGPFGEVYVVDWGLSRLFGSGAEEEPVSIDFSEVSGDTVGRRETRAGATVGTPGFMAPEQKRGIHHEVGPRADVFSLGVVLFQLLTNRRCEPPDPADTALAQHRVLQREPHRRRVPEALVRICLRAVQAEPARRYADARGLARDVERWLEGAERREQALELVQRADALRPTVARMQHKQRQLQQLAAQLLERVPPHRPVAEKRQAWALEAGAEEEGRAIERLQAEYVDLLGSALRTCPELPEARGRLARFYRHAHGRAVEAGDTAEASRMEASLRAFDDGQYAAWLQGDGSLSIVTDPPGAQVQLYRFVERDRRLVAEPEGPQRTSPFHDLPLPMGRYLASVSHKEREEVRYPVWIPRRHRWSARPPGAEHTAPIVLPPVGSMGPQDCYVPAGWFRVGGDRQASLSLPGMWVWADAFVMRRFPVTNVEYVEFLKDLSRLGFEAKALAFAPQESGTGDRFGALVYDHDLPLRAGGASSPSLEPHAPVVGIPHAAAEAYAAWLCERTGLPWRLPGELEWEKAARGVDGRFFPWGDHFDPTRACSRTSTPEGPALQPVESFPEDLSPYGVRGLAGNIREWCADVFRREGHITGDGRATIGRAQNRERTRVVRGGCWADMGESGGRSARREAVSMEARAPWLGFRLVRSV